MNKLIFITILLAVLIVGGVLFFKSLERIYDDKIPEEENEEALIFTIEGYV